MKSFFNIHCILFLDVWPRTFILVLCSPRRRVRFVKGREESRVECGGHGD